MLKWEACSAQISPGKGGCALAGNHQNLVSADDAQKKQKKEVQKWEKIKIIMP